MNFTREEVLDLLQKTEAAAGHRIIEIAMHIEPRLRTDPMRPVDEEMAAAREEAQKRVQRGEP